MPQPIYMPPDPSGWGPILSGGIDRFTEAYLKEKERKQQANQLLLNAIMQYGGTISPEQMGQIESTMGLGQTPIQKITGKIGSALGITPEPKPYESPLRRLFEPVEGGYKIKGQAERGLETFKAQKQIEEPFEIAKEKRGIEAQKEIATFRTDEEIRGALLGLEKVEPKRRKAELDKLKDELVLKNQMSNVFIDDEISRAKKAGDMQEAIRWETKRKELALEHQNKLEEIKATYGYKATEEVVKEAKDVAKERKADYNKTIAAINTAVAKLPGEEITDEELEKIGRIATSYGFKIEQTPIKKTQAGIDWLAKDKWTYKLIDPETGQPVKVHEENLPKEKPKGEKPTYKYNPVTGKLEKQ